MLEIINTTMLVLIEDLGYSYPTATSKQKSSYGIYRCSCGVEFKTRTDNVQRGNTKSCGCYKKHGLSNHPLYHTWDNMIRRTNNPKVKHFDKYGGRGIEVCERWMDINKFIEDMYPSYQKDLSIDRIDNNGNYEPNNCRWATKTMQSRNKRLLQSNNTSGYRGVSFHKLTKRWRAVVGINGNKKYIGTFAHAIDAAKAYDNYVLENNLEHTLNKVVIR